MNFNESSYNFFNNIQDSIIAKSFLRSFTFKQCNEILIDILKNIIFNIKFRIIIFGKEAV